MIFIGEYRTEQKGGSPVVVFHFIFTSFKISFLHILQIKGNILISAHVWQSATLAQCSPVKTHVPSLQCHSSISSCSPISCPLKSSNFNWIECALHDYDAFESCQEVGSNHLQNLSSNLLTLKLSLKVSYALSYCTERDCSVTKVISGQIEILLHMIWEHVTGDLWLHIVCRGTR